MREEKITPAKDQTTALCLDTMKREKQALVFCSSKRGAESQAEKISKEWKQKTSQELQALSTKILKAVSTPTKQCKRLAMCVLQGVAFHHAGLTALQREAIEDAFREGTLLVICSTPTLAAGLDLPAFRAIIRDTKRFGQRGMMAIPVLEYEQMAGRAGRPGKEEYGEAILIAGKEQDVPKQFAQYVNGEIEDIYSKLAVEPVLRTYILSLVSTELITTRKELLHFFDKTFYAKQFGNLDKLHASLDRMSIALQEWGFLEGKKKEKKKEKKLFMSGTELLHSKQVQTQLKASMLGKRVSEIYLDPLTANQIVLGLQKLAAHPKDKTDEEQTFALIHLLSCSLELRPLLRTKIKDVDMLESQKEEIQLLFTEDEYYEKYQDDFNDSIKTSIFLQDWINEFGEEQLLEKYNIRPGEINAKIQRMDWLLYSAEEIARISQLQTIIKIIRHLRDRVKHGVKSELITLLRFKGVGRIRARKLFRAGVKTIQDVKRIDIERLAQIVGPKLAKSMHEETGLRVDQQAFSKEREVEPVSNKKRVKQTKLHSFSKK